jgi:hypothetical protein
MMSKKCSAEFAELRLTMTLELEVGPEAERSWYRTTHSQSSTFTFIVVLSSTLTDNVK